MMGVVVALAAVVGVLLAVVAWLAWAVRDLRRCAVECDDETDALGLWLCDVEVRIAHLECVLGVEPPDPDGGLPAVPGRVVVPFPRGGRAA